MRILSEESGILLLEFGHFTDCGTLGFWTDNIF